MRSVMSGLIVVGVSALLTAGAMVGCTADGTGGGGDPAAAATDPNLPADNGTTDTNPSGGGNGTPVTPAPPAKDGSAPPPPPDAGYDAGPPPPAPGDPCTSVGKVYDKMCGFCGTQSAICLAASDGGADGGSAAGVVSVYSACTGEVANGCTPGSTFTEACGRCGTHTVVCQNNCTKAPGSCTGEPANACAPGTTQLIGAGCNVNEYRSETCNPATCQWTNPSACGPATTPYSLTLDTHVGTVVSAQFSLSPTTDQIPKVSTFGTCPLTSLSSTSTSYSYVEVKNPTATTVEFSVWGSAVAGGVDIDTLMAAYPGASVPMTDAARKACVGAIDDTCKVAPCPTNQYDWAGLVKATGEKGPVSVPAHSSVIIYTAAYSSSDTGVYMLNVKTES